MQKAYISLVVFLKFILLVFSVSFAEETTKQTDPLCGPRSLLTVCQILGVETNLEEISKLSSMDKETGTTMLGLYHATQRKGLKAEGMKMDIDELAKLKTPSVVHIKGNHFFVVERFEKSKFRIIDPPKEPYYLSKEELSKVWDGNVLVISRKPPPETEEPNIIFEEYLYHFGKADQNQKIEHIFRFRNTGKQILIVSKVRTTCGCMVAPLSDKEIPPGEEGEIKAIFSTGHRRGKQSQLIYVHSNDPDESLIKLILTGRVKAYIVISPKQLYFGNIQKREGAIRRINIFKGEEKIRISRIEATSKHLFAKVFNIFYGKKPGYEVIVALSPDVPIGPIKEKITIYTDNSKKPQIEIPIEGEVKGAIEIFPGIFSFGFVKKGENLSRKVTISTNGSEDLKIEKVETDIQSICLQLSPLEKGKRYALIAELRPDTPEGFVKGVVKLHTNSFDQPVIEVPVYGLVCE